jgi:hypothetical protein
MADYYPLIARAMAGLDPSAPGESRRALYERARAALIAQLRRVQPPLSESEVTRERASLEEAIREIEAEAAQRARDASRAPGGARAGDAFRHASAARAPVREETDPLAELARLIGQTDPLGNLGRPNAQVPPRSPFQPPEPADGLDTPEVLPWIQRARMSRKGASASSLDNDAAFGQVERSEEPDRQEIDAPRRDSRPTKSGPKKILPPISTLPEQNERRAIAFRPSRRGPLELLPDPVTDFLDPEQSQLYARMRAQLVKLQEDIPSQERTQIDDVINDFLDQPSSWQAVEFKKVLWLCGNALRNKLAQHDAVKDDLDPHYYRLPAGVAAALRKPVETWNVFALGDEDLVELDSKRLGPQEQQTAIENINAARPIVEHAAIDRHITTEQTGHVLTASLEAASSPVDNVNTKQAQYLAEGTSRNLVFQIVRRGYLFCQNIIDPQTDEARALTLEYKKGIATAAGTATFAAAVAAVSYGAPHAASFFEFVAGNADILRAYVAIALQNDQLRQVIDVIEYTRTSLKEKPPEAGTERPTNE